MPETHQTFCRICEALCGLEVDVDGGRVVDVRPDARHVATSGFACLKGLRQHPIYASPDRVRRPLRRDGAAWSEVSWERANAEIGAKVRRLRAQHGPGSIAMYVGTAAGFGVLHPVFAQGFMLGLGSKSMYSSATQDCSNKFAVARHLYGFPFTQPFPDVDSVKLHAELMPGTVALPHGWGRQHAKGLTVASKTRGVNVNLLAGDGPDRLERVSGMAHLTGFVVEVRPAAGAQDAGSWSGIGAAG